MRFSGASGLSGSSLGLRPCRLADQRLLPGAFQQTHQFIPPARDPHLGRADADAEGAECATCPFVPWCAGLFKWPDPARGCDDVRPLLGAIGEAATQVAADLAEARALLP